jgi:hypothetical protein
MSTKKFTAASKAKREIKADFEIDWEDDEGEHHTATFWCFPGRATGAVMFDLTTVAGDSKPMWEFFETTIDDFPTFEKFLRDPAHGVEADTIREIVSWMIEYDTGTPTPPPAS